VTTRRVRRKNPFVQHKPKGKIIIPNITLGKENGANIDIYYKNWGSGNPAVLAIAGVD